MVDAVLADHTTAPIPESLRLTLGWLKKVTLSPTEVRPEDLDPLLAAGVSKAKLLDALYVAFSFNIYDRLADTLGWELPASDWYPKAAKRLLSRGYAL